MIHYVVQIIQEHALQKNFLPFPAPRTPCWQVFSTVNFRL